MARATIFSLSIHICTDTSFIKKKSTKQILLIFMQKRKLPLTTYGHTQPLAKKNKTLK